MKMLKDSIWANGSALLTQIIALGTTLVVARFVGPSEYGLVATGLVILLFFQRFLLESFGFSVIREMDTSDGYIESANYCSIVFGYISSVIMLLVAVVLYFCSYQNLSIVIIALSIIPILDGYGTIRTCLLRRDGKFKQLAGRVLIANTCAGIFAIVLAINNFGIWALIVQQIILAICNLLIAFKCANWKPLEKISKSNIKKIMKFGFPMMGNSVIFVAANRVDVLFLSFLSTPTNVGVYAMSRRITRTIPDIFVSGSNSVLFTRLRGENFKKSIDITVLQIKYIMLILVPILTSFSIFSNEIIGLIFGSKWLGLNMHIIVKYLCVLSLLQVMISFFNTFLISLGMTKKVLLVNTIQFISFLILILTGLFFNSINAENVSVSFILSSIVSLFVLIILIYGFNLRSIFNLFQSISMLIPVFLISYYFLNISYFIDPLLNMAFATFFNFSICFIFCIFFEKNIRSFMYYLYSKIKENIVG